MDIVKELLAKHWDEAMRHRRWLHENPDLSHMEEKSSAYIAAALREIGLEPQEGIGGYGVTAMIEGKGPGKCVGLRADFDALPVTENTGLPYSSKVPGVAHACGHDAHSGMLLAAAMVFNDMRDQFNGSIKLVFQPSEEDAGNPGAKAMIKDGLLENPHVDAMFGQHVWPTYTTGKIAIRNGAMMAASDRFYITVKGKNSHGSAPESGVDAIVIAAQVITALQTIISRNVGPLDSAVITIGTVKGGTRYNIIADEVYMEGTCRNLSANVRDAMASRMENIIKGISEGMGGSYKFRYDRCYSPLVNDPDQFRLICDVAREVVGEENLIIPENSALGGEDFSFYSAEVPSGFYWLGCRGEGKPYYPIHNGAFAPEEESLAVGAEMLVKTALRYLAK